MERKRDIRFECISMATCERIVLNYLVERSLNKRFQKWFLGLEYVRLCLFINLQITMKLITTIFKANLFPFMFKAFLS